MFMRGLNSTAKLICLENKQEICQGSSAGESARLIPIGSTAEGKAERLDTSELQGKTKIKYLKLFQNCFNKDKTKLKIK